MLSQNGLSHSPWTQGFGQSASFEFDKHAEHLSNPKVPATWLPQHKRITSMQKGIVLMFVKRDVTEIGDSVRWCRGPCYITDLMLTWHRALLSFCRLTLTDNH